MHGLISRLVPKTLWGQTPLMLVILAIVLSLLRAFTSQHYFMAAVTVCYGFVIGWFAGWLARRGQENPSS
jgi:phosphatidylglycerophosphate synthase